MIVKNKFTALVVINVLILSWVFYILYDLGKDMEQSILETQEEMLGLIYVVTSINSAPEDITMEEFKKRLKEGEILESDEGKQLYEKYLKLLVGN